jgi:hypothetical protein
MAIQSTMRVLRTISTPWVPYSVIFSRDGSRIAIGGGGWYGDGGLMMVDLSSESIELFPCVDLPRGPHDWVPTISGLCFSEDDRHLAVSSWRPRHHYAPTFVFEVSGLTVAHRATLSCADSWSCPTGVIFSSRYTITRNHRAAPDGVLVVHESPPELRIRADNIAQHWTNAHLVVVREEVITAGRGLAPGRTYEDNWRTVVDFRESGAAVDEGLVSVPLDAKVRTPQLIPVKACREVTAITATPDASGFVTGGLEGELDRWSWRGCWRQERLREWTYDSKSVVGICYVSGGQYWVTLSSGGELDLMAGSAHHGSWQLPTPGSPRALAAHPARNWIAIGTKQSGGPDPKGVVDLIEIEPPVGSA